MSDNHPEYSAKPKPAERRCAVCHCESLGRTSYKLEHEGITLWLCSRNCLKRFAEIPCRFECQEKHIQGQAKRNSA